jgi:hypothetical protein
MADSPLRFMQSTDRGDCHCYGASQNYFTFGFKSSWERGLFMFSLVIRLAPVSTNVSTFSPLEAAKAVLIPS